VVRLAVGALVLTAASLWMTGSPDPYTRIAAWVGLVLFGVGTLLAGVRLVRPRPVLEIDADGVTDRSSLTSIGHLRWSDIDSVEIRTLKVPVVNSPRPLIRRVLSIAPRDWDAALARVSLYKRLVMRLNGRFGYEPVNIMESMLPYSLETLVDEMRRLNPRLVVEASS
jgi:hypothetical protein